MENISNELKLLYLYEPAATENGCLLFDVYVHFPYSNVEDLVFDYQIDGIATDEKRLIRDHNREYLKYCKSYGQKVNIMGYPMIRPVKELYRTVNLTLTVGFRENKAEYTFPVLMQAIQEKPLSVLRVRYMFDDNVFVLESFNKENGNINRRIWINEPGYEYPGREEYDDLIVLSMERNIHENHSFRSQDIILPCVQSKDEFVYL